MDEKPENLLGAWQRKQHGKEEESLGGLGSFGTQTNDLTDDGCQSSGSGGVAGLPSGVSWKSEKEHI